MKENMKYTLTFINNQIIKINFNLYHKNPQSLNQMLECEPF